VDQRLTRLTPVGPPGLSRSGVRAGTWWLVRAQIRRALTRLGIRPHAVLAGSLDDVLGRWGTEVRDVLYGTDDYVAGAALMGQDRTRLLREERRQLARADVVLAVSPPLRDRWVGMGARPVLVPNGVEVAAYSTVDTAPSPSGVDLPHPVVGLVGQLSDRIDCDLLDAVADAGCSLLLVGPHDPGWLPERFAALVARPNVTWVGRRPFAELPSYLRLMSVGITPYRNTAFNRASFPLKTLEYLAAGLPVVSTDLPAVEWLDTDLVATASDPASFAGAVLAAAGTRLVPELVSRRRQFAARHSWECRADQVADAIGLDSPAGPR
ncbi:MAG TPA: glycosyltransferase, partial [Mycobacteriales bacterium]